MSDDSSNLKLATLHFQIFKMMGPPTYYFTSFVEDHECMWSGECCSNYYSTTQEIWPEDPPKLVQAKPVQVKPVPTKPALPKVQSEKKARIKSSTDNKKLRHREVEKNRHRQLQAMVRTLSKEIPGATDKETQVQTMKRAARYCLYLRNVKKLVASNNVVSKDRLEVAYLRSVDTVDHLMSSSQRGSAAASALHSINK